MFVVDKPNGGIRISVDLTKLNKYVKRTIHPGPRIHGISIVQKKFIFAKKEVKYLGFIVNENGVKSDPNKVRASKDIFQSTSFKEV